MVFQTRQRMTAEEYRQLPETSQRMELIEGELIVSPSVVTGHQRAVGNTYYILRDDDVPPGEAFMAPLDVYFDDENVFQPDVFWVAKDNDRCVERDGYFYGPPDLVIEVLLPSTARYDKTVKFLVYEKYGVREYWLADPKRKTVEVWRRGEEEFTLLDIYSATDTFVSVVLGDKPITLATIFDGV